MITKFDSLFAGHIDMDNVGYGGTPVNDRRFPNEQLAGVFDKAQAMAQLMDRVGYNAFWMAEHHFQHEGYECIPNVLMMALHLAHVTKRLKIGCGFNITPMWHPLRLAEDYRDGGHPDRRARHLRGRARLSHARGRNLRLAAARPAGQPRALRRAGRHHLQGVQRGIVLASRQALHLAARGAVSRLHAQGADPGAPAVAAPGRVLAADPGRHGARHGFHGKAWDPGADRRRLGRGRGHAQGRARVAGGACPARPASRTGRAAVFRLPLLPRRKPRAGDPRGGQILRREHEDVRRAAPGAGPDRRADRDHARSRARPHRQAAADRGCDRQWRRSCAARPSRSSST